MNIQDFWKCCWLQTRNGLQIRASRGITILCFSSLTFLSVLFFLSSCIEPFDPVGVQDTAGILVVEGMILEKGTTIKLSRTIRLDSTLRKASNSNAVRDARVQVIDESKNVIATAEPQFVNGKINPGVYVVNGEISFNSNKKFALDIHIADRHYQSAFVAPVHTPAIDDITWKQNEDESIDIMVSTHDPENRTNYFRWAFVEDWEYRAWYFGRFVYIPNTSELVEQSLAGPNNRYYCWDSDISKTILLGSSDKHTESAIRNKKIHNFQSKSTRFSYLYSILVKQYGLDKEAYIYFDNIKKNIELSGSFFAPQPTELRGNIKCLSHPDEYVIGYIVAATEVVSRIYIDMDKIHGEDVYNCGESENFFIYELYNAYLQGWGICFEFAGMYVCAPIKCVDCLTRGGTKNKPDFWPNDHQ